MKYYTVSVPDYGELILNYNFLKAERSNAKYDVSVPDYGELILNYMEFNIMQFFTSYN